MDGRVVRQSMKNRRRRRRRFQREPFLASSCYEHQLLGLDAGLGGAAWALGAPQGCRFVFSGPTLTSFLL